MFSEEAETNENVFNSTWYKSIGITDAAGPSVLCCKKHHAILRLG